MKKLIYFLPIAILISCTKYKKSSTNTDSNYNCECETKTEFIDNCRMDSTIVTQSIVAANRNKADENCKAFNSTSKNSETITTKECELSE